MASAMGTQFVSVAIGWELWERTGDPWALGLVGMVQSAGDWWLERRPMSRAALTDHLTAIIWGGLSAVLEAERV